MQEHEDQSIPAAVEGIYRNDSRRVLATLIRLLGDFDLAEEALHDAFARGDLEEFHLAHAARADLCRRMGMRAEAAASYRRALALVRQEPERRFLAQRLEDSTEL